MERLDDRLLGHRGLHAAAGNEAGDVAPPFHARAVPVGVAFVLAQVHVEPRRELAAKGEVEQRQTEVGRIGAWHGGMGGADHRLGRAGFVKQIERRHGRRLARGYDGGAGGRAVLPVSQRPLDAGDGFWQAHVAGQDKRRPRWLIRRGPERLKLAPINIGQPR